MNKKNANEIPLTTVEAGQNTQTQILIGPEEAPNFAMRRFIMQPGGGMPKHTNKVEHEQYVLRGEATIGIGNQEINVKQDDVVFIPAEVAHWYRAEGDTPFEFLCIVPNSTDEIKIVD
jgi:quercetin dioxygenase-like cupin family protein|tara:strand:+ start:705 stop:1058 length:354 start_codon:yes stop_codon:yes gene_type:complete